MNHGKSLEKQGRNQSPKSYYKAIESELSKDGPLVLKTT